MRENKENTKLSNAGSDCSSVPCSPWFNAVKDLPPYETPIILCINGIVQEETYYRDEGEDGNFWNREELDEGIYVEDGQVWQYLPEPPKDYSL